MASPPSPRPSPASGRGRIRWVLAWTAAAAALRAPGLFADFWLDEIWSLDLARTADGLSDVLYGLETSNNHILLTAWLRLTAGLGSELVYRLPSYLAGLAAVPLAAAVARRWGAEAERLAAPLAALWAPLLWYSTEARGYAIAAAAALAAWAWSREPRRAWAFGVACAAGLLSQLVFVYIYAALLAAEALERSSWSERVRRHALPAVALLGVALPQARRLLVDGPGYDLARVGAEAIGLLLGTPAEPGWALIGAALALGAFAGAAGPLRASRDAVFLALVFGLPIAAAASGPQVLFSRYFLPAAACFLPVLACALGRLWAGRRRPLALAAVAVFAAAQVWAASSFLAHGRGGYREAVRLLASEGQGVVRVASDHDFRNRVVLEYHAARVPPGKIVYLSREEAQWEGSDWFLVHRLHPWDPEPAGEIAGPRGRRYRLARVFRHGGPSGWDWYLYKGS